MRQSTRWLLRIIAFALTSAVVEQAREREEGNGRGRLKLIPAQVATPARLDALRDRVPWAPGAALLVDGAPDAKGYTPFTLPDAKGALAATVAGLLGATDVAFGVVES